MKLKILTGALLATSLGLNCWALVKIGNNDSVSYQYFDRVDSQYHQIRELKAELKEVDRARVDDARGWALELRDLKRENLKLTGELLAAERKNIVARKAETPAAPVVPISNRSLAIEDMNRYQEKLDRDVQEGAADMLRWRVYDLEKKQEEAEAAAAREERRRSFDDLRRR